MRIGDSCASRNDAAANCTSSPITPATAIAASAFIAMCLPGTASEKETSPQGVVTVTVGRAKSSKSHDCIRISAAALVPYVRTEALVLPRIAATRSSSALRIAVPDASNACTNSAFARATPSIPPTRSVWASATAVTTPICGLAIAQSREISPNPRIPISKTSA